VSELGIVGGDDGVAGAAKRDKLNFRVVKSPYNTLLDDGQLRGK
jgi:hypothetical protein